MLETVVVASENMVCARCSRARASVGFWGARSRDSAQLGFSMVLGVELSFMHTVMCRASVMLLEKPVRKMSLFPLALGQGADTSRQLAPCRQVCRVQPCLFVALSEVKFKKKQCQ